MGSHRAIAAAAATAVAALAAPAVATAQPAPPPERYGVFGGGALWAGNLSCDGGDCGGFREAIGASGHLGWMLTPRLGLLGDIWGLTSSEEPRPNFRATLTFITATVNLRYWLVPALWIQGGIGNGHARARVTVPFLGTAMSRSDDVFVATVAAGFEVVRGNNWALDVSVKLAQGSETDFDGDSVQTGRAAAIGAHISFFGSR